MTSPPLLILMRHGESMWNRSKEDPSRAWRYAGSVDVPLSTRGVEEAVKAGEALKDLPVDVVFTSNLVRASTTAFVALNNHSSGRTPFLCTRDGKVCSAAKAMRACTFDDDDNMSHDDNTTPDAQDEEDKSNSGDDELLRSSDVLLPVIAADSLIERSFGSLAGVSSTKHKGLFTPDQLKGFREDFRTPFPNGESSKDVYDRVIPYFKQEILPLLLSGKNVLVVSHGFVMRVLIQFLEGMDETEWSSQMKIEKSHPLECRLAAHTGVPQMYALADKMTQSFVSVRTLEDSKNTVQVETKTEAAADVTKRKTQIAKTPSTLSTPVVAAVVTIAKQLSTSPRVSPAVPPRALVVSTAHLPTETLGESLVPSVPRQPVAC